MTDEVKAAKTGGVKTIRALSRGLLVLRMLQQSGGMGLNDLYRTTRLPKATLLRILATLEADGLVWQRIVDNAYLASHMVQENVGGTAEEKRFVELASPLLEKLTRKVRWPSILAVPRLAHMEVIEATAPRSYFHYIELGPVGFQINMVLSATGRAYLAFCPDQERELVLDRLRHSQRSGDRMARDKKWMDEVLASTRERGYAVRDPRFGGSYDLTRRDFDDRRDSLAVPVMVDGRVPGCINLTWIRRVTSQADAARDYLDEVRAVADELGAGLARYRASDEPSGQ